MDIWDITRPASVWKPDDGCRVWATTKSKLPTIPSYFTQTHRNSVEGQRYRKGNRGKVRPLTAEYDNDGTLQWNDVYHAKADSVPLRDTQGRNYPAVQWCYEGGNGIHATYTKVLGNGITLFSQARYYSQYWDPQRGRRTQYGPFNFWLIKVLPDGTCYAQSIHMEPKVYQGEGQDVYITSTSRGLEALIGTVIGTTYDGAGYGVPDEYYRVVSQHYADVLEGLLPADAPWQSTYAATKVSVSFPNLDLEGSFLLNENGLINMYGPLGVLQSGMVREELLEKATFEAMSAASVTWDNGLQNLQGIFELGKLLKSLKDGDFSVLPKRANDLWLQYRYVFSTSKMDAEEGIKALMRKELREKLAAGGSILVTGQSSYRSEDLYITCKCHLQLRSTATLLAEQLLIELDNWGMIPDSYLVWDLIPYSFIIDWFVPIGDALAVNDMNRKFEGQYKIEKCLYSFKYTRDINGVSVTNYSRWVDAPVIPQGLTFMVDQYDGTSTKTVFKRVVDVVALLMGRK